MIAPPILLAVKSSRLAGAPRLMAAYLMRSNRAAPQRLVPPILLGLGAVLAFVVLYTQRDWVEESVKWLRHRILAATGLAIIASAIAIARRRVSKRAEFARSWLAALPVRARTAGWETLLIEMLPAVAVVAALTGAYVAVTIVAAFTPANGGSSAAAVWAAMSGAVMLGAILSYGIPNPKPIDLPPASRYVPHRHVMNASTVRPSLKALGIWPLRLIFARAQPKLVARSLLPVLLLMLMGTSAAAAMVIIAFYVVAGALLLLIPAAISVSSKVRGWVAPLPVRASSVMQAVLVPTLGAIIGASAAEGLFLFLMEVSLRTAAVTGLCMAAVACLVTACGSIAAQARVLPFVRDHS
jgi:hypothetical protein